SKDPSIPRRNKINWHPSEVARTEAQQLKIVLRSFGCTDEGTGSKPGVSDEIAKIDEQVDTERGRDDDEESKSEEESDGDETREDESFDPIPRTPEESEDDGNFAADLSEMELKKILIEKMEGNKSIQCSDEQRNLYKALVDAYEADKTILDSYRETVYLKRRCDDDDDQEEGPSGGSDRGSNRQREGKEPESASAPLETATRSAGRSTNGSKSRQVSASEFAFTEEHVQTISQMDEPSYSVFETSADDQTIVQ
nr:hypothetical protein [Tanacetum cinerariifolium]